MASAGSIPRMLLGEPLRSDRMDEKLLPKRLALPVLPVPLLVRGSGREATPRNELAMLRDEGRKRVAARKMRNRRVSAISEG